MTARQGPGRRLASSFHVVGRKAVGYRAYARNRRSPAGQPRCDAVEYFRGCRSLNPKKHRKKRISWGRA
jgi:hypothetical protein